MNKIKIFERAFWIIEIKPNINKYKLKRPTKHTFSSLYRDYPHITIKGKGLIAKLKERI